MFDLLLAFDTALFRAVNSGLGAAALDPIMLWLSSRWTWAVIGAGVALWALARRQRRWLQFVVVLSLTLAAVDGVTYNIFKPLIARERPCHQLEGVRLVTQWCGGDFGCPSNHAANGMAAVCLVWCWFGRRRGLLTMLAVMLVGFTRIYLGVHFPGDILVGFAVGGISGMVACKLARIAGWPTQAASSRLE